MSANKLMLADVWHAAKFNHITTPVDFNGRARRAQKPASRIKQKAERSADTYSRLIICQSANCKKIIQETQTEIGAPYNDQ